MLGIYFLREVAAELLALRYSSRSCNKVEHLASSNFREVVFLAPDIWVVTAMMVAVPIHGKFYSMLLGSEAAAMVCSSSWGVVGPGSGPW